MSARPIPTNGDWRGEKRALRRMGMTDPVRLAYNEGEALAYLGPRLMPARLRRNPYPPGKRHAAWEQGYSVGAHHGRNT